MLVVAGFFDQGFFHGLIMLALAFCWGFALYDLFTRRLSGWKKLIWFAVIILLPFLGTAIYLMASPIGGYEIPYSQTDYLPGDGAKDPRPQIPHGGV